MNNLNFSFIQIHFKQIYTFPTVSPMMRAILNHCPEIFPLDLDLAILPFLPTTYFCITFWSNGALFKSMEWPTLCLDEILAEALILF